MKSSTGETPSDEIAEESRRALGKIGEALALYALQLEGLETTDLL